MKLILELNIAFCLLAACLAGELRYNCTGGKVALSEELKVFYDTNTPLQDLMLQGSLRGLQGALGTKVRVSRLPNSGTPEEDLEVGHIHKLENIFNKVQVDVRPKPKPKPTSTPPNYTTTKSSHETTPKPPPNPDSTTTAPPNPTPATTATPNPPNPNPDTTAPPNPNPDTTAPPNPNPDTTAPPNPNPDTTAPPNPNPDTTAPPNPNPDTTTAQQVTTPRPIPVVTTSEGRRTTEPVSTTPEGRRTTVPVTTTAEGRKTKVPVTTTPEQRRTTATKTPERRRTTPAPVVLDLELSVVAELELIVRIREEESRENGFRLSIGQTRISLSADSLAGAVRGLEALVELREKDRAGGHSLSQCEVY